MRYTPAQLWAMEPDDFNRWRAQHELPSLLHFFKSTLPEFTLWMSSFHINDTDFISAPHTGRWFSGDQMHHYCEYTEHGISRRLICEDVNAHFAFIRTVRAVPVHRDVVFVPYLKWASDRAGRKDFIPADAANQGQVEYPVFNMWSGIGGISKAYLLKSFVALKLGHCVLEERVNIGERNLDFTDMDGLIITGSFHGSGWKEIQYSSCNNLTFKNTELAFFRFTRCKLDHFSCEDSALQDMEFRSCDMNEITLKKSRIHGLSIHKCPLRWPNIDSVQIERFDYAPTIHPEVQADTYRRLRSAFQSMGARYEEQYFYYLERCAERRDLWTPWKVDRYKEFFPRRKVWFPGFIKTIKQVLEHKMSFRQATSNAANHFRWKITCWFHPAWAKNTVRLKARYFSSLFSWLVWGYGLKVSHLLFAALTVVIGCATSFYISGETAGDAPLSLYYSVVTFTTLGYGDITQKTDLLRLLSASEALLGAVFTGMFIGVMSRKNDY